MNTKDAVIQSYMDLVIQKNTTDVKVADICHNANISRKTFYNYFADKQEILECIFCEEIEKTMINGLQYQVDEKKEVIATYKKFLKHKDFFMIAMKSEGQNSLFDIIITHCSKLCRNLYDPYIEDKKKLDYLSYKYATSSAMLLKKWMHEGMEESAEFLAEIYLSSIQDLSSYKHGDNYK